MAAWEEEVESGERFRFGANWAKFVEELDEARVVSAEAALRASLGVTSLEGRRFLDAGCGSGLHSLAARRLGADVVSFDFDAQSVATTRAVRERFRPDDEGWQISRGSVLDAQFLSELGDFDIVYSWGVLHHTGDQWRAMELVAERVVPDGELFLALYNDQGLPSRVWTRIKRSYVGGREGMKYTLLFGAGAYFELRSVVGRMTRGEPLLPFEQWRRRKQERGMSVWTDLVDWVGGYPFEVSRPEEVFRFYRERGFELTHLMTCGGGLGCNEFVFRRVDERSTRSEETETGARA